MQLSSYGSKTAFVGLECALACDVPKKFNSTGRHYIGEETLTAFKTFDANTP